MENTTAPVKMPPGPKRNMLLSRRNTFSKGILQFLQGFVKEYPGIGRIKTGTLSFVVITNPDYVEHVFMHRDKYVKVQEGGNLRYLLGNGLLTSEGEFWMKQRKLIQPVFHKQRLQGFVQKITDCTNDMLDAWEQRDENTTTDMLAEMNKLTLDIVGKTLLSTDVKGDFKKVSDALTIVLENITRRRQRILQLPYWVPVPEHVRMQRYIKVLNDTVMDIINQRRKDTNTYDDLLTMLMEVEDADTAERMSDTQLRDEALTIFIAGHETTANAMSFIFYLLARNPAVKQRMEQELSTVLGAEELSYEKLMKLEYTQMVIKEAMRLYPPAWVVVRRAASDDVIDGYQIKEKDIIIVSPYAVQHSDVLWDRADEFDPERFAPANAKSIHRYAYFPFGGGARLCIGNNFAMMEMQIILALISKRFNYTLPNDYVMELNPLITLRPKKGVPVYLKSNAEQMV